VKFLTLTLFFLNHELFEIKGVFWPTEGMPTIVHYISNFTPLTHAVEAMRCIALRGIKLDFNLYK